MFLVFCHSESLHVSSLVLNIEEICYTSLKYWMEKSSYCLLFIVELFEFNTMTVELDTASLAGATRLRYKVFFRKQYVIALGYIGSFSLSTSTLHTLVAMFNCIVVSWSSLGNIHVVRYRRELVISLSSSSCVSKGPELGLSF